MQALQIVGWQQRPELREVPVPQPGPGEVLVRIGASGACHTDVHLMYDAAPGRIPWDPPWTLGHENAGWVAAIGAGVSGLEPGQPVAVYPAWGCGRCGRCLAGWHNYCSSGRQLRGGGGGLGLDGGMAEHLLVPDSRYVVPLRRLDPVDAAPLTDAGLTPYHAIKRSLPLLGPGSTAAVVGLGGLGHVAVQLLRALSPATVVGVDINPAARDLAGALGADLVVDGATDGVSAEVLSATGDVGVDLYLDFVGSDATLQLGAAVTRSMGHLTLVGSAGGSLAVARGALAYEASVTTTYFGSLPELVEVIDLAEAGAIRVETQQFPLDRAVEAYDALGQGQIRGRAVVVPPR